MIAEIHYGNEIKEICKRSEVQLMKRIKEVGIDTALTEATPYQSMWDKFLNKITDPVEIKNENFSGFPFMQARINNISFINCDFAESRWVFFFINNTDCSNSNFSNIRTLVSPFNNVNCSNCNFENAELTFFDLFKENIFLNADFTNAKIESSHSFFEKEDLDTRGNFENAIMEGCSLTVKKEKNCRLPKRKIKSRLRLVFSSSQLKSIDLRFEGFSLFSVGE